MNVLFLAKEPLFYMEYAARLENNGISFWCVADNIRIGAALNTVRICKKVIEMGLYGEGNK